MSHYIYAKIPGVDAKVVMRRLCIHLRESDRFREFEKLTQVARVHRSCGNPLSQVIYLCLGVMDEAYATNSGRGIDIDITVDQFSTALEILNSKSFDGLLFPAKNALVAAIATAFEFMGVIEAERPEDVQSERDFLEKCLAFCQRNALDHLTVHFG